MNDAERLEWEQSPESGARPLKPTGDICEICDNSVRTSRCPACGKWVCDKCVSAHGPVGGNADGDVWCKDYEGE